MVYFDYLPGIGSLYLEKILFEFEKEPIVFICNDKNKNKYLCLCTDSIISHCWMIAKISIKKLIELMEDKITILQGFDSAPGKVFIVEKDENGISYKQYNFNELPQDELPDENEKLECANVHDYLLDLRLQEELYKQKIQIMCEEINKSFFSIQKYKQDFFCTKDRIRVLESCWSGYDYTNEQKRVDLKFDITFTPNKRLKSQEYIVQKKQHQSKKILVGVGADRKMVNV